MIGGLVAPGIRPQLDVEVRPRTVAVLQNGIRPLQIGDGLLLLLNVALSANRSNLNNGHSLVMAMDTARSTREFFRCSKPARPSTTI